MLASGIKANLRNHLLVHDVNNRNQHGFLRHKSTTTQLLECCCDWQLALNGHSKINIIYLDFSKAFDSVVDCKLIAKLECYGVDAVLLAWIRNFLVGRSQFVRIAGACSEACTVTSAFYCMC